jgi:small subunit ribosomal protein S6
MKYYELLCILPGTLGEDEVAPAVEEVKTLLAANGATTITSEDKGKSRLAYPIKHIRYGYAIVVVFQAERNALPVIQAKLRLINNLLRAMINEFDPVARKEKDLVLAKLARDRAEYEKPRQAAQAQSPFQRETTSEISIPRAAVAVAEAKKEVEESQVVVEPAVVAKKTKKASTEKPTEENMSAIEEKLNKVLDSTLEEV